MKIKSDFVTNSSSTSYILGFSKNINIEEFVDKNWEIRETSKYISENNNSTKEDIINAIHQLVNNNQLYESENLYEFQIIREIFKNKNMILDAIDVDSNHGIITIVTLEHLEKILKDI